MTPTIGRIIHVIEPNIVGRCIAAIVTALDYGRGKDLTVFVTPVFTARRA